MTKPILHLIHGFIGAGKTTFAKKLEKETGAVRFTADEWMEILYGKNPPAEHFADYENRIKTVIDRMVCDLLAKGVNVIHDLGLWGRADRDYWRAKAKELGAEVALYDIKCPLEVMKSRTLQRTDAAEDGSLFIDENAFDLLLARFEPLQPEQERITVATKQVLSSGR